MEAQQIITMSINKITGSRGQRGGVNLRKNLLVATVLHSARALYYEEMCNMMARNAELQSRERDTSAEDQEEEEEDCTEAPDWEDESAVSKSSCLAPVASCETDGEDAPTQDKENCHPATDASSPVQARLVLEKPEPCSTPPPSSPVVIADPKPDSSSPDKERVVLGQKNMNSALPKTGCAACKRKRSDSAEELREACESILPKRAKSSDSESQTEELVSTTTKQNSEQGSITSLVTIFKSGFHGLSGESSPKTANIVAPGAQNHLQQSSYGNSMPRPFEQLQMPIAAC